MKLNLTALIGVILFAALYRVMPHPYNVTPIGAMALFVGAHLSNRWVAFIAPVAAMLISDLVLNFTPNLYVYLGMLLTVGIGLSIRAHLSTKTVFIGSLGATASFFLLTNFGAWLGSTFYPQTPAGLMQSYLAGVPFLQRSLLGDLFFTALFFGGYMLAKNSFVNHKESVS